MVISKDKPWCAQTAEKIIDDNLHREGPLLPVLHSFQEAFGFISEEGITSIATRLNLSVAEVQGVISFYPAFRRHPKGKHLVQVCRAEACQAVGGEKLEEEIKSATGLQLHQSNDDITLEPVYCLGNCACGPSMRVDDEVYGRVDKGRLEAILQGLSSREGGAE